MKHAFLALPFVLLTACQEEKGIREVVQAESPNGQPFHFMNINEDDVSDITIKMAWPTDWIYDAANNPVVPLVASEAILSGGTDTMRPQDVMEMFDDKNAGGWLSATTDIVHGELGFPKEHIDDVVGIAAEMLANPQFDEAWVERIKQGIQTNNATASQDTNVAMWEAARTAIVGDQPLLNSLNLATPETIDAVSVSDLRDWHARTLTQTDVTIAVTGAISEADAGKVIDQILAGLPKGETRPAPSYTVDFAPKRIYLHLPDAEKTTLGFVTQLPATTEGGDMIDLLALNHFSAGLESPLNDAIRTELRASYGFQAGYANFDRPTRVMFIAGEVEAEKLSEAVTVITDAYESHRTAPNFAGFEDIQKNFVEGTKENIEYVDSIAATILEMALDGQDVTQAPKLAETLGAITQADVTNRFASVYPSGDQLFIVAAGPLPDALEGACVITDVQQAMNCP